MMSSHAKINGEVVATCEEAGMSPEMELLDQLCGDAMPLSLVRSLFPDDTRFVSGLSAMLATGVVLLISVDGIDVPAWQWRHYLADPDAAINIRVRITKAGSDWYCQGISVT